VVLSKGCEVVRPGYSRVIDVATKVMDKREISGNHDWVNWVGKMEQHYPSRVSPNSSMDRWIDGVSQNSYMDWQADWVGQVSWVGQVTGVSPNGYTD
jgi:hypothetical protein